MILVIFTKNGKVIKFNSAEVPVGTRGNIGVKAVSLKEGDEVVAVVVEE